jgi:hypothetical protein
MKKEYWLPALVFLIASIPTVLLLQHFGWGGDYVLLLSMGAGVLATSVVLPKLKKPTEGDFKAADNAVKSNKSAQTKQTKKK